MMNKSKNLQLWACCVTSGSALVLCIGCTHELNDRMTLGGAMRTATFQSLAIESPQTTHLADSFLMDPHTPRSSWEPHQLVSPMDGVVHSHHFILTTPLNKIDAPRIYGRFPTPSDALQMQSPTWFQDILLSLNGYGRTIVGSDTAFFYLLFTNQLFEPTTSPSQSWKRTNFTAWSSGFPQSRDTDTQSRDMIDSDKTSVPSNNSDDNDQPDRASIQ
jgi:hypothetical protein